MFVSFHRLIAKGAAYNETENAKIKTTASSGSDALNIDSRKLGGKAMIICPNHLHVACMVKRIWRGT